ncbi:mitochondrial import inner membrane translocase subunit TIM50-like [Olea europaea subsp. europaea]|uniref:Mitochondrial import inner membrane translocase subunit TIM50 n=1 Tax=Olea europaea subsp. europaea TaxID=158383 RepID=A0A8S0RQM0_OLEEU|nr:mitochondrial import inner membrane translocase subunit TIM50-like [Olea europaea subsp. europaea]
MSALVQSESRIFSSSTILNQPPPPPETSEPQLPESGAEKKSWSFLKYGLIAALAGGFAASASATYAYSLEEVDQKTKAFRASANYTVGDDASSLDFPERDFMFQEVPHMKLVLKKHARLRILILQRKQYFAKEVNAWNVVQQHIHVENEEGNEEGRDRGWRTFKRPGVDAFLEHLAQLYEIVVYSDLLNMYVDPVVDMLDPKHCIRYRLSRGATRYVDGKHYRVCIFSSFLESNSYD